MLRAHEIALDVNDAQRTGLARAAGCARVAYNWALERWGEQYQKWREWDEAGRVGVAPVKPSEAALRRELNSIKAEQYPWMYASTKCAPQEAIRALGVAFKNFFAGRGRYPVRKRWRTSRRTFTVSSGQFAIDGDRIRVPNIGWVRMRESLRWAEARPVSVTFHERAGRWFASVRCEIPDTEVRKCPAPVGSVIGLDLGVREYATSDGKLVDVPRAYRKNEARLRRAQQALSRRQGPDRRTRTEPSNRWKKQAQRVRRVQARTADIRKDFVHKLTHGLAARYETAVLEDLNVSGMAKNSRLAKSVLDAGFGECRRQIEYKTADRGGRLILADRWFPSSKKCSACGVVRTTRLPLSIRAWKCENCGASHHRDINAAINLKNLAASSAVTARGAFLSSAAAVPDAPPPQDTAMKRESDIIHA